MRIITFILLIAFTACTDSLPKNQELETIKEKYALDWVNVNTYEFLLDINVDLEAVTTLAASFQSKGYTHEEQIKEFKKLGYKTSKEAVYIGGRFIDGEKVTTVLIAASDDGTNDCVHSCNSNNCICTHTILIKCRSQMCGCIQGECNGDITLKPGGSQ